MLKKACLLVVLILSSTIVFAQDYSFPLYNYESLIQVDKEQCRLDIKNQQIIAQKHYEANLKLMAMQWLGKAPALKDTFNIYKALPGLSLQNDMRYRDMYIHEQMAHEVLDQDFKTINKLGGNAGGNNYNRLQAKNGQIVFQKLSISQTYLAEMESTVLRILGFQSVYSKKGKEAKIEGKGGYDNSFEPGFYEATYFSSEYEKKHNKSCMWSPDRMIKESDPYCGFAWKHGDNFYLERCPGDVHPFGRGHAASAGVATVKELFKFKAVKECQKKPSCGNGCFNSCIEKNQFNPRRLTDLVEGQCEELVDPLFPKDVKSKSLTKEFLKDSAHFNIWYPKFKEHEKDIKDVAKEIERYYLMTGEYTKEDCKKGKRKFLLEVLDAIKQLISLESNLKEFYDTSSHCHIKLAKDFEEKAMEGTLISITDRDRSVKPESDTSSLMAVVKNGAKKQRSFSERELKEMEASYFGLTYDEQTKMINDLVGNDYKFSNDNLSFICKRSKKKDFCGGK